MRSSAGRPSDGWYCEKSFKVAACVHAKMNILVSGGTGSGIAARRSSAAASTAAGSGSRGASGRSASRGSRR